MQCRVRLSCDSTGSTIVASVVAILMLQSCFYWLSAINSSRWLKIKRLVSIKSVSQLMRAFPLPNAYGRCYHYWPVLFSSDRLIAFNWILFGAAFSFWECEKNGFSKKSRTKSCTLWQRRRWIKSWAIRSDRIKVIMENDEFWISGLNWKNEIFFFWMPKCKQISYLITEKVKAVINYD